MASGPRGKPAAQIPSTRNRREIVDLTKEQRRACGSFGGTGTRGQALKYAQSESGTPDASSGEAKSGPAACVESTNQNPAKYQFGGLVLRESLLAWSGSMQLRAFIAVFGERFGV